MAYEYLAAHFQPLVDVTEKMGQALEQLDQTIDELRSNGLLTRYGVKYLQAVSRAADQQLTDLEQFITVMNRETRA